MSIRYHHRLTYESVVVMKLIRLDLLIYPELIYSFGIV